MITLDDRQLIGKGVKVVPSAGSAKGHTYYGELVDLKTAEAANALWDMAVVVLAGAMTETHWRLADVYQI